VIIPAAHTEYRSETRPNLREAGMIKSDPNQLIAKGTAWQFLNELRRELKA
jgi:hypothetical protein